jgi:predicted dehydrogenase/threonine dehydrogenase-like Zn-dependent dehydrogenase
MKQVIRRGLKEIIVDEVSDPIVTPHHVLVRPHYSLISAGTETADIHTDSLVKEVADNPSHLSKIWAVMKQEGPLATIAEVRAKFKEYAVLGYSGAGEIVDLHPTVTDLQIGDRVAYGGEGTGHGETVITGRNLVARMPAGVSFADGSMTTLGSIAMNAVRIAEIGVGDVVAVIGLGLVGQLVAQLVSAQGGVVVAIDINGDRVDLARSTGADHGLVAGDGTPQEVIALTAGIGADCVIVAAAAKSPIPVQQAVQMCRDRGRVVIVGAVPLDLPRDQMYIKELRLLMARAYGPGSYDAAYEKGGRDYPLPYVRWTENRNMEEFLRLVATKRITLGPLVSHEFALDDAPTGYATIMDPAKKSLAVLLRYPAADAVVQGAGPGEFAPVHRLASGVAYHGSSKDLSVALVGAGNLAKWAHLPNLKKIAGVNLRAVYSTHGARGKSYAKRFGAEYSTTEYDQVLNDPNIDMVLITSRHQYHADQALRALAAGKNVFIEKPLAITIEECRAIVRAEEESKATLTVGFNRRFSPFYVEQKRLLERRTGPAVINCRMNSPGLVGKFWAADPKYGGAIIGEGCHFVDLLYWMLGREPVSVAAHSLPMGQDDPIGENNIAATFRYADGSIANLTYCTVGSATSGGERLEVFAPGIGAMSENMKQFWTKAKLIKKRSSWFAEKGYRAQMEGFVNDLKAGRAPAVSAVDGARATIGGLLMLESARTGQTLPFDLKGILEGSLNMVI